MRIVDIIKTVAKRVGLDSNISSVVSSNDEQIIGLLALAEEEGQELTSRYNWNELIQEASWTTLAQENQGAVNGDIIPTADCPLYQFSSTFWNRDTKLPVYGPDLGSTWQARQALVTTTPYPHYRIRGGDLLLNPAPPAGQELVFEYYSCNWIINTTSGTVYKELFSDDEDVPRLDSRLIILGTTWRWKAARGLPYGEDFNKYERRLADVMARDATKPIISLTGGDSTETIGAGTFIPAGNWTINP